MKKMTIVPSYAHSLLLVSLVVWVASCNDDGDDPGDSKPVCLLATQVTTGSFVNDGAPSYDYSWEFAYQYDDANNLVEFTADMNYLHTDGRTSESHSHQKDEYENGYLIRRKQESFGTNVDGVSSSSTTVEEYTYKNGRLVERAHEYVDPGAVRRYADYYEYDGNGLLVRLTTSYNTASTEFTYSNGAVSRITYIGVDGSKRTAELSYNGKGQLVKSIETQGPQAIERRFEYTTDGLVAREERYENGTPQYATIFEYDNYINPLAHGQALPKGFPDIPNPEPALTVTRNYTSFTYIIPNDEGNGWTEAESTRFSYIYNGQGFPTQRSTQDLDDKGEVMSTANTIYTYTKCP